MPDNFPSLMLLPPTPLKQPPSQCTNSVSLKSIVCRTARVMLLQRSVDHATPQLKTLLPLITHCIQNKQKDFILKVSSS